MFQDDDYKLGSVCNPDARIRAKALAHLLECVDIMDVTGSRDLKLWFGDGTNYPGQDDIGARQDRLAWVAYPKAGKLGTDLNRDILAALLTAEGVQPVRQVAIDETWSALRFRPA